MNIACLANITGVVSVKYENITQLGTIYIPVGQLDSYLIYINLSVVGSTKSSDWLVKPRILKFLSITCLPI